MTSSRFTLIHPVFPCFYIHFTFISHDFLMTLSFLPGVIRCVRGVGLPRSVWGRRRITGAWNGSRGTRAGTEGDTAASAKPMASCDSCRAKSEMGTSQTSHQIYYNALYKHIYIYNHKINIYHVYIISTAINFPRCIVSYISFPSCCRRFHGHHSYPQLP